MSTVFRNSLELRSHINVPDVMQLAKILKVFWKVTWQSWQICTDYVRGGSHGNGEKSFFKLCVWRESRMDKSPICVDFWEVAWISHQSVQIFQNSAEFGTCCFRISARGALSMQSSSSRCVLFSVAPGERDAHNTHTRKKHTHIEKKSKKSIKKHLKIK